MVIDAYRGTDDHTGTGRQWLSIFVSHMGCMTDPESLGTGPARPTRRNARGRLRKAPPKLIAFTRGHGTPCRNQLRSYRRTCGWNHYLPLESYAIDLMHQLLRHLRGHE